MFDINERNKIFLTLGDTASLYLQVYDAADNKREPQPEDVVTFSIDDTEYSVEASQTNDGRYVFNLLVNDIDAGVYSYRIVLVNGTSRYTIFEDEFIELLGSNPQEQPEPEPEPDIDLDPDPEIVVPAEGTYAITFGNPVCYVGDTITVKMRIAPEVASVDFRIPGDSNYLQMLNWTGGLGNATLNGRQILDYKSTGASIAEYEFSFKTLKSGTANLTFFVNEICDSNGNQLSGDYSSSSTVTIRSI